MNCYEAADQFIEDVASSSPTPGGGAVAAHTGALGCALASMAVATTLKKKDLPAEKRARLEEHLAKFTAFKESFKKLTRQDALAYENFLTVKQLPKEDSSRAEALQKALCQAAQVPTDVADTACHTLEILKSSQPDITPIILSDAVCARHLLQTCIRLAVENIRANVEYIQHPDTKQLFQQKINEFSKNG